MQSAATGTAGGSSRCGRMPRADRPAGMALRALTQTRFSPARRLLPARAARLARAPWPPVPPAPRRELVCRARYALAIPAARDERGTGLRAAIRRVLK